MIYYADVKDNLIEGFYCKEVHGDNIPSTTIPITEELWQELLKLGQAKITNVEKINIAKTLELSKKDDFAFDISYLDCFSQHFIPITSTGEEQVSIESRVSKLEEKMDSLTNQISQLISTLNR